MVAASPAADHHLVQGMLLRSLGHVAWQGPANQEICPGGCFAAWQSLAASNNQLTHMLPCRPVNTPVFAVVWERPSTSSA